MIINLFLTQKIDKYHTKGRGGGSVTIYEVISQKNLLFYEGWLPQGPQSSSPEELERLAGAIR